MMKIYIKIFSINIMYHIRIIGLQISAIILK
jgi:hypothetical protein